MRTLPYQWLAIAAGVVMLSGGCARPGPSTQPTTMAVTPQQALSDLRTATLAANPGAQVGLVIAVLPSDSLVAVGDVDVTKFERGDVVTIVDLGGAPIVAGSVVQKTADAVHVKYGSDAKRAPAVGDLAVKLR